ncbi:MAG TPA: hypothetical protein VGK74_07410 [Symbiobacteriaceae bacterium]|jgi:hypothetical protein
MPNGWLNPFNLAGIVVGALMLLLMGAVLFRIQVPLITGERTAVIALGMMVLKVLLAVVRGMVY